MTTRSMKAIRNALKHQERTTVFRERFKRRIVTHTAFYLAGKIQHTCWRHGIVNGLRATHDDYTAREHMSVFGVYRYTGPFFDSCDHGCAHGPSRHGFGADVGVGCQSEPSPRHAVSAECLYGVRAADVVFVWVCPEFDTAYGTLVEIGFAASLGKEIVLGVHPIMADKRDFWFAETLASSVVVAETAEDALRRYLSHPFEHFVTLPLPAKQSVQEAMHADISDQGGFLLYRDTYPLPPGSGMGGVVVKLVYGFFDLGPATIASLRWKGVE